MLREHGLGRACGRRCCRPSYASCGRSWERVDGVLDDDRFLAPFRSRLTATVGRPTIPIETYLRLMCLKYRYGLGYETFCMEVSDSFTWRRFCRIALDGRVPDPSTLMKLTKRLGPGLLEELNAELLSVAVERKVLRSRRLRVDATIVGADMRSPTDSGLCAQAVSRLERLAKRVKAAGLASRGRLRDRRRSVGERVRAISAARVRGRQALTTLDRLPPRSPRAPSRRCVRGAHSRARRAEVRVASGSASRWSSGWSANSRRPSRSSPRPTCRNWKRRYRYRNGLEGRISQLKRKGLRRTRSRSLERAQTWIGGIALAHNLQRMALLT